jgi:hypothetical protein
LVANGLQKIAREAKPEDLREANKVFRSLQLSIQILEGAPEIILLFVNQGGVSEPVNSLDKAAHHQCRAR